MRHRALTHWFTFVTARVGAGGSCETNSTWLSFEAGRDPVTRGYICCLSGCLLAEGENQDFWRVALGEGVKATSPKPHPFSSAFICQQPVSSSGSPPAQPAHTSSQGLEGQPAAWSDICLLAHGLSSMSSPEASSCCGLLDMVSSVPCRFLGSVCGSGNSPGLISDQAPGQQACCPRLHGFSSCFGFFADCLQKARMQTAPYILKHSKHSQLRGSAEPTALHSECKASALTQAWKTGVR